MGPFRFRQCKLSACIIAHQSMPAFAELKTRSFRCQTTECLLFKEHAQAAHSSDSNPKQAPNCSRRSVPIQPMVSLQHQAKWLSLWCTWPSFQCGACRNFTFIRAGGGYAPVKNEYDFYHPSHNSAMIGKYKVGEGRNLRLDCYAFA